MGSRSVTTDQDGPHPDLEKVVRKHLAAPFLKPVADHTRQAFDILWEDIAADQRPIILDSCCGTGDSTRYLAGAYPDHLVIGVDKSSDRLGKERPDPLAENARLVRADLNDFYRLWAATGKALAHHKIYYPNPWPKAAHLKRRWHGAPVFRDILRIPAKLEVRSNWRLYIEEFAGALGVAGLKAATNPVDARNPVSLFERKYAQSGQDLWRLEADIQGFSETAAVVTNL